MVAPPRHRVRHAGLAQGPWRPGHLRIESSSPFLPRVLVPLGRGVVPKGVAHLPSFPRLRTLLPAVRRVLLAGGNTAASLMMPIYQVLVTIFLAFALALVFGARGLVHAVTCMNDGLEWNYESRLEVRQA